MIIDFDENMRLKIDMKIYSVKKFLGQGVFSTVWKVMEQGTTNYFAAKVSKHDKEKNADKLKREYLKHCRFNACDKFC